MKKLIELEKITWKTWQPRWVDDFPCLLCHKNMAEYRVKYQEGDSIITLNVCKSCLETFEK